MATFYILLLALALVVEIAVIVSCIEARMTIGRGFGVCLLAQITFPALLIAGFHIWNKVDPPALGPEGLASEAYARSFDFIGAAFWTAFITTMVAGIAGGIRWMTGPRMR